MFFYDTCSLINTPIALLQQSHFYISSVTLQELENIKTSANKDPEIKYKARKAVHFLIDHQDDFSIIQYISEDLRHFSKQYSVLENDTNDNKIIVSALSLQRQISEEELIFITQDLCCANIAKMCGLQVQLQHEDGQDEEYTGFKIVSTKNDTELGECYNSIFNNTNIYNLETNQYLIIKNNNEFIDCYKKLSTGTIKQLPRFICFNSKMFGKIKPKDTFQLCAMDALQSNQISMLRGKAGSGKSLLALAYLFEQLEKGKIDKVIMFCNSVATVGAARLGFYPGSKDEKLLDAQIGNFLGSKLGAKEAVLECIEKGQLLLLPMSDIRGFDTSGMNAGVYITEAQNLDIDLMKLALQRIGEDSICILDGDSNTQVDLGAYAGAYNGMRRVSKIFRGQNIYGEVTLQNIYRSKIASIAEQM